MKKCFGFILCALMAAASAIPYYSYAAEEPASEGSLYMLGDWKGERSRLSDKGVTFDSTFVCDYLANVAGGMQQAGRYDHSMGWDINFDLEKFADLGGTQFHISGLWRQGQNLSKAVIGNDLVVSTIYGHEQFRFYSLYLEKTFWDKRISIKAGRIAAGDDFASSSLYGMFVSNSIDGVPISVPINLFFTVYPTATWGTRAKVILNDDFYILSGIYNGDKGVERDSMYGLDFSLRLKKGIAFAQELAYVPNTAKDSKGLPGHYKAGIYYNGAVSKDLYSDINGASYSVSGLAQKKHIGNYNIYFHADQMIYREDEHSDQGLTPLACITLGPENLNKFPFFLASGMAYKGLIPGRDTDSTAFLISYAKYSEDLKRSEQDTNSSAQHYEIALEFTHRVNITKWMYAQPDLQYIIQPGGTGDIDDALVIGAQFGFVF